MPDSIRNTIEQKDIQFHKLFTEFQVNIRKTPHYLSFEAFKDLKIIFDLYSETYHLKGFNYNYLKVSDINKLISKFDPYQKKELIEYLIKSLAKNGMDQKAKELFSLLSKLELICAIDGLKKGCKIPSNIFRILHHSVAYNKFTLLISSIFFLIFSSIIYLDAPCKWMEIMHIEKKSICHNFYFNHFANVLFYIFDFDEKMSVMPLNFFGVLMIILLKSFLILIVINFFLKEFFNRLKLS